MINFLCVQHKRNVNTPWWVKRKYFHSTLSEYGTKYRCNVGLVGVVLNVALWKIVPKCYTAPPTGQSNGGVFVFSSLFSYPPSVFLTALLSTSNGNSLKWYTVSATATRLNQHSVTGRESTVQSYSDFPVGFPYGFMKWKTSGSLARFAL